ncbi:HD-GYP domain-containing protein [Tepidibacter thalassicus]|uniref:HD-GYP domain, c-di-GMP phosphodiesterase class II (Or its inactivated variant) n=1 Tax=Tepidibacter thalassicus DSM 15285 TaxID=1123350 RepID=A0A1M5PKR1_9FIRM|nr:HD-GYP domain-containing protein [Tepidibacter thalassicus]SHH02290.1 HD-GYP domain, c-di-GMP phosphodiesterase class II (or its inactivated variant) [Tepidibacter thalassicus DSM 15285]
MLRLVNINYIDVKKYEYYVGRPIYCDGLLLLQDKVKLNENYIKQLILKGINYIYVVDEISEGIEINEIIPNEKFIEAKQIIKDQFNTIKKGKNIGLNMTIINNTVSELLDILTSNRDISYNVNQLRIVDDYLYEHSLNVTVSCIYIGILLKYDKIKLQKLALGALLHDIGKTFIDSRILNKPSKLTADERKEIEKHPELGYRYINDNYGEEISSISKQIILQHHEKWNGTGYPNQLSGEAIYILARICSIADVFDALTTDRVYRKAMTVYAASEYIYSLGYNEFDFEIVKLFLSRVVKFKEGSIVKLSDGSKAIVYSQNKCMLDRPVVKLLVDKKGRFVSHKNIFLDLMEEKTLFIEKQLENIALN